MIAWSTAFPLMVCNSWRATHGAQPLPLAQPGRTMLRPRPAAGPLSLDEIRVSGSGFMEFAIILATGIALLNLPAPAQFNLHVFAISRLRVKTRNRGRFPSNWRRHPAPLAGGNLVGGRGLSTPGSWLFAANGRSRSCRGGPFPDRHASPRSARISPIGTHLDN